MPKYECDMCGMKCELLATNVSTEPNCPYGHGDKAHWRDSVLDPPPSPTPEEAIIQAVMDKGGGTKPEIKYKSPDYEHGGYVIVRWGKMELCMFKASGGYWQESGRNEARNR